jgi:hypothetical protein
MKKLGFAFGCLLALTELLAVAPIALASTTWYVDGIKGNDGNSCLSSSTACKTIGHAISLASSGDSVMVAPAIYTENLTISIGLKIMGSGANTTIVDGGGMNTVFTISGKSAHVLSGLTIRNGYVNGSGAGVSNVGTLTINSSVISGNSTQEGSGGGIYNSGTLTVNNSTISGNSAWDGGGISNVYGGTLTVNNSTISGNAALGGCASQGGCGAGYGGGIGNIGILVVNNSTISGNNVSGPKGGFGGGIASLGNLRETITISNVTFSGNGATLQGGNIDRLGGAGRVTIQNSIVANATSGGNCGGTITSQGYNLSDDDTCSFSGSGDMNNTIPMLGALGNNGGPTQTIAELTGSPTVDAGNPNGCTNGNGKLQTTDQRGYPRPGKNKNDQRCDMGAYESQSD